MEERSGGMLLALVFLIAIALIAIDTGRAFAQTNPRAVAALELLKAPAPDPFTSANKVNCYCGGDPTLCGCGAGCGCVGGADCRSASPKVGDRKMIYIDTIGRSLEFTYDAHWGWARTPDTAPIATPIRFAPPLSYSGGGGRVCSTSS